MIIVDSSTADPFSTEALIDRTQGNRRHLL
jgi:hypothetical protein